MDKEGRQTEEDPSGAKAAINGKANRQKYRHLYRHL